MSDMMVAREQLRSVVERIERLEEEKKAIADDIRDVYAEAKGNGFDTKVLRQVVSLRKKDLTERQEQEAVRDLYMQALGMLPDFESDNYFNHNNPLPKFFWTGNTKMNCLKQAITNSLENAYAHHIQRLMVTGNFSLLTLTNPKEVDNWYLGIYADAIQWVQLPNTRGMSQYADGGKIATKPYISSGSYINKMSNYCTYCHYNRNKKTEDNACPFNSLYWNFLEEHRNKLENNFRMKMMYSVLDKMKSEEVQQIKNRAQKIIANPDDF